MIPIPNVQHDRFRLVSGFDMGPSNKWACLKATVEAGMGAQTWGTQASRMEESPYLRQSVQTLSQYGH